MNKKIDLWRDRRDLVEDQLNLQVTMQFEHHHQFMLGSGLSECRQVIDLGTGNGSFLAALAEEHHDISFTGVDNKEHMIDHAGKKEMDNISWLVGDVNDPNTIPGLKNVDGVLMRYLLLHLKDADALISKLHEVLKPNAKLWIIDLDIANNVCKPPDEAFDIIDRLVKRFCDEHGKDINIGSRLVNILEGVGFKSVKSGLEPLNTDSVDMKLLQRFIYQEVLVYHAALQNILTDEELDKIRVFIDNIPRSGTFINYGVTLVSAVK